MVGHLSTSWNMLGQFNFGKVAFADSFNESIFANVRLIKAAASR